MKDRERLDFAIKLAEEALLRATQAAGGAVIADSALFGNGSAGDVVVSVNDPNFGGVRSTYRSLTINAGVTVTIAAPDHALILRVQNKITIAGAINGAAQITETDGSGDLLVGPQLEGGVGAGGGGGGGGGDGGVTNGYTGGVGA